VAHANLLQLVSHHGTDSVTDLGLLFPAVVTKIVSLSKGSGYRTARGFFNLKHYSTVSCNATLPHDKYAVGLVKTGER